MSTATDDASPDAPCNDRDDDVRAAFATAEVGDEVDLAIGSYSWTNPLEVVAVEPGVEWDVRFGTNWLRRELIVEATSVQYALVYDDTAAPRQADCHRYEDGVKSMRRGPIKRLTIVDPDEDANDEVTAEVLPDDVTPGEIEVAIDTHKESREGSNPKADLDAVADELDLTTGRARVVLRELDFYDEVREAVSRPGGGR